jgi:putative FmdB family regulatory protein
MERDPARPTMPIYEYRCSNCGHELEALQKFSEPALTACPACHQSALAKLVSAAGFQLKGSGWYATDFRNTGKPAAKTETAKEGAATAGEAKGEAKSESKGEAKPESKGEAKPESKGETKSEAKPESKSEASAARPAGGGGG